MNRRFLLFLVLLPLAGCSRGAQVSPPVAAPAPQTSQRPQSSAPDKPDQTNDYADSNEGNLLLGNPTNAAKDSDNYLVERPQYTLSYNRSKGEANWVAWHIDRQDLGGADRGKFRPDPALPPDWQISPNDYRNSGYDRGHVCPSGDRTSSREDNDATFYMSNMLPQTAELNRAVWADAENGIRDIVREGNEVYVIAGGAGEASRIADGKVVVPKVCWKVVVILPEGTNDLKRIGPDTRVLAIAMPNVANEQLKRGDWRKYIVTTKKISDAIQSSQPMAINFFAALPAKLRETLESKIDTGF